MTGSHKRVDYTWWCTRDCDPDTGEPSRICRVWLERPRRQPFGARGSFWMAPSLEGALYAEWSLDDVWSLARTVPDDGLQCIRVDADAEWKPGMPVDVQRRLDG